MIDLASVKFFHYDSHNGGIDILVDGTHLYFSGADAKDLYESLKDMAPLENTKKELITETKE